MLKAPVAAAAAVMSVVVALPAAAQTQGPTPGERVGIHTGDTATNGSAVVVTDRNGTHPEGYPGMALRNRTSAANPPHRHHRRHHMATGPTPG
ncbi:MAG: hypothetical protein ACHP9T_14845 [Caulobacterales bacterium]|jgi:hypothetical protein